jgi:hypothetical protein
VEIQLIEGLLGLNVFESRVAQGVLRCVMEQGAQNLKDFGVQVIGLMVKMVVAKIFIADGGAALFEQATTLGKKPVLVAKLICLLMNPF